MKLEDAIKYLGWMKELEELSDQEINALEIAIECIGKEVIREKEDDELRELYPRAAKRLGW
jgi:hypothetical protein